MSAPVRIQLSRAKGWRMPENTVKVDRSTRYGNPWRPGTPGAVKINGHWLSLPMAITPAGCVDRFRRWLAGEFTSETGAIRMDHPIYEAVICDEPPPVKEWLAALRGRNVGCWCKASDPCHADVWRELANAPTPKSGEP